MSLAPTLSAVEAARRAAAPQSVAGRRPMGDLSLGQMRLRGNTISAGLAGVITDAEMERTIEGASTLTLHAHDRARRLLSSGVLHRGAQLSLDGLDFVLVRVEKSADGFSLVFEDAAVWALRQLDTPRKAVRGAGMTRARFIALLVEQVRPRIALYAPERDTPQPVAEVQAAADPPPSPTATPAPGRQPGFGAGASFTVKGVTADPEQRGNLQQVLRVGTRLRAGRLVQVAAVMTVIQESVARNLTGGDADSVGLFQQRRSQGWPASRDIERDAQAFYERALEVYRDPSMDPGDLAQAVQHSGHPDAYAQWRSEAERIVTLYLGGGDETTTTTTTPAPAPAGVEPYEFSVGQSGAGAEREDYWSAIKRLADEVQWRCFMSPGLLSLARDKTLLGEAPRYRISQATPGVDRIDWTLDEGMVSAEATITCFAPRWGAPPGTVVDLVGEGPASGLWLVGSTRRGLRSAQGTVTLTRPRESLVEPAPQAASPPAADPPGPGNPTLDAVTGQAPASVVACYRAAEQIDSRHEAYRWGGGHGALGDDGPYDCSGFVSNVLGAGGLIGAVMSTSGLIAWGEAGQGQHLTVWVRETGDPRASHCFCEFTGFPHRWAEAGGAGGPTGWRADKSTAGFSPRHSPGT